MTSDISESGILIGPSDVCTLLGIKESALRKYTLLLKDTGYQYHVIEKGQRGYFDKDVLVLKKFIEVKSNRDMTLEQVQASEAVIF
jgi:DNA-binding transcriptional MerR regulator